MRSVKTEPKLGDFRFVKRFLFLPLSLTVRLWKKRNLSIVTTETRWLEYATIKEKFVELVNGDGEPVKMWEAVEFVDKPLAYDER